MKSGKINSEGNIEYSIYDEFKTNVMQWARHPDTKPGDAKIFNRKWREFVLLEATEDGYVELKTGKYRHFKGMEYEVIGVARHSETEEPMVVYRALYGEGGLWVRPLSMWNEQVDRDDYHGPRFYYVGE